ncbi:MAG: hypothetical protein FWC79_01380 [Oscillospiraceae bacterium]|nr:hypothetical protein [Oscillospiraceae bacterium]
MSSSPRNTVTRFARVWKAQREVHRYRHPEESLPKDLTTIATLVIDDLVSALVNHITARNERRLGTLDVYITLQVVRGYISLYFSVGKPVDMQNRHTAQNVRVHHYDFAVHDVKDKLLELLEEDGILMRSKNPRTSPDTFSGIYRFTKK